MSQLTNNPQNILQQVKLSGKIPEIVEGIISRQVIFQAASESA